jgi:NAD-dependent dihydropyrimidine dehydrogenase PreA subunit
MTGFRYLTGVVTLELDAERCSGCRQCLLVCPQGVFDIERKKAVIVDRDACMECGACALNCPENAIAVRAGVGCAAAIVSGALRGTEPTCCCGADDEQAS